MSIWASTLGIEDERQWKAELEAAGVSAISEEYCMSFINTEPLDEQALAGLQAMVGRRAEEWVPACEHDTNPWVADDE